MTRPPFKPSHGNSIIPSEAEFDRHYAPNDPGELPASVQRDLDEEKREEARALYDDGIRSLLRVQDQFLDRAMNINTTKQ